MTSISGASSKKQSSAGSVPCDWLDTFVSTSQQKQYLTIITAQCIAKAHKKIRSSKLTELSFKFSY